MIVVRLRGGLGNQLFQYAMGRRIALQYNTGLKLDLTSLLKKSNSPSVTNREYQLHIFNIEEAFLIHPKIISFLNKYKLNFVVQLIKFVRSLGCVKVKEKSFTVDHNLITTPKKDAIYSGYWQSETYFNDIESQLRKDLEFKEVLSPEAQLLQNKIKDVTAVCVHVRRGDYVGNGYFQTMDNNYFKAGADYLTSHNENLHFFIFSDEPEWCKTNIDLGTNFTVVDYNTNGIRYKEDLELMASCDHFILSPSSFSWWACWLSTHERKMVVAPKKWFPDDTVDTSDLIGESWKRI
ncbi:alpha-1,2-fucosyltransferase [Winogradskyella sp. DF17]|uniref:Alpha-1,2-fucosyltransferase n=1 Tax=Winogradskyella pelagia TaxID=2819984 RepID=A0ABS3T0C2_9FLAO|nr:alpha-1,2-fucosyltransferase [Winogradskyella sp. DF17]MBO3116192.1 alpha-1,2-fucosyltransferase [Winogradskyella sp. DF17]